MILTQDFTNHDMDNREMGTSICHSSKRISINNGSTQSSSAATTSLKYTSPARVSKNSNKQTQLSSPAAHYVNGGRQTASPDEDSMALTLYFESGGEATQTLADAIAISHHLHKVDTTDYSKVHPL